MATKKMGGEPKEEVLFRVWKPTEHEGDDAFALFPTIPSDSAGHYVNAYEDGMFSGADWAKKPMPNGKYPPVQFASDADWLAHTLFPVRKDGRLAGGNRKCESEATWPEGQALLDRPYERPRGYELQVMTPSGHWRHQAVVDIRPFASPHDVETVLSRSGVYMPRGKDTLAWSKDGTSAVIREFGDEPAARIIPRSMAGVGTRNAGI